MAFCMMLVMVAGVRAYFHLGQNEDPAFTVKTMVVRAYLPGATMEETLDNTSLTVLFMMISPQILRYFFNSGRYFLDT